MMILRQARYNDSLGEIAIKDGDIVESITKAELTYDLDGRLVTPGLIDCHTHLVYAGDRSEEAKLRAAGMSYQDIAKMGGGILSTVNDTRNISFDGLYEQSAERLRCFLREGVTTIEIKSGYGLDLATERKILTVAKQLGDDFPVTVIKTFLGAHTLPLEYKDKNAYINVVCHEMLPTLAAENLIDHVDVFCESIAFNCDQAARIFEVATQLMLPIKIHAEQLSNQGATALSAQYRALSADHLEYLDEGGVQAMANAKMTAVLLPGAFHTLQETQCPPIFLLLQHNVPIAIASDCNPGTSPYTSLLEIMRLACDCFDLTPAQALQGVTEYAAKALALEDRIGAIRKGLQADLAVWNVTEPDELLHERSCFAVIKAGQWIPIHDEATKYQSPDGHYTNR